MAPKKRHFESPLPGWLAKSPVAAAAAMLYRTAVEYRNRQFDSGSRTTISISRPVISIGGIRAGGTGKTPAVMLINDILQQYGYDVAVLSRGYKRTGRNALQIAPGGKIPWERIGDEPAMIRAASPQTWLGIGPDRAFNAGRLLKLMGPRSLFLLDDGFQHRCLHRDLDIACLHESLFSDRMLPQGFLREPVASLHRARMLFLIGTEERLEQLHRAGKQCTALFPEAERFVLLQKPQGWINLHNGEATGTLPLNNPVALCGIARPERFLASIAAAGITPCRTILHRDHHRYSENDFSSLRELYSQGLITTEKDAVRIRDLQGIPAERIWYLKVRLHFSENESSDRFHRYIKGIDK